jgi:hypothetical protein
LCGVKAAGQAWLFDPIANKEGGLCYAAKIAAPQPGGFGDDTRCCVCKVDAANEHNESDASFRLKPSYDWKFLADAINIILTSAGNAVYFVRNVRNRCRKFQTTLSTFFFSRID